MIKEEEKPLCKRLAKVAMKIKGNTGQIDVEDVELFQSQAYSKLKERRSKQGKNLENFEITSSGMVVPLPVSSRSKKNNKDD